MGTGLLGYAAGGRCQTFGLNFGFVGQGYDEILIALRGLVLGVNSKMSKGLQVKYPIILLRYKWNFNFLDRFSKNAKISNFMKIF